MGRRVAKRLDVAYRTENRFGGELEVGALEPEHIRNLSDEELSDYYDAQLDTMLGRPFPQPYPLPIRPLRVAAARLSRRHWPQDGKEYYRSEINQIRHWIPSFCFEPNKADDSLLVSVIDLIDFPKEDGRTKQAALQEFPSLKTFVPWAVPQEVRFEHQFVLAPSGSGKTTLLQTQIVQDFDKVAKGDASIIVIDGENALIPSLSRLAVFAPGGALEGRLIVLEPEATHPLSLNIFDVGEVAGNSEEQAIAKREIRDTILSCVSGTNETQDAMLRYLVQLCLEVPGATLDTLLELLTPEGFKKHEQYLEGLNTITRRYFETTYKQDSRRATKEAVQSRLNDAMSEDTFANMFVSQRNKFKLLEEMEKGRVILINTKRQLLGAHGCQMFGRFFLSQLVHASLHRNEESKPVFCYVDECQDYISTDEQISEFLLKARKRRIAMILATQEMGAIASLKVRESLQGLAIRFTADKDQPQRGKFKCHIRRTTTDGPVDVQAPAGVLQSMARMSAVEYSAIHATMRERYCRQFDETAPRSLAAQFAALEYWTDLEILAASYDAVNEQGFVTVGKLREWLNQKQLTTFEVARDQRNGLVHDKTPFHDLPRWIKEVRALHATLLTDKKRPAIAPKQTPKPPQPPKVPPPIDPTTPSDTL